jgi:hypothetical protein
MKAVSAANRGVVARYRRGVNYLAVNPPDITEWKWSH